jgi:hypothetical protein
MSDMVRIWSFEHNAWWAPDSRGYTQIESKAGLYRRTYAEYICAQANYGDQKNEEIREVPRTKGSGGKE